MRKALASALVWVLLSAGPAGAADLLKIPKPTDKLDPPPPPPALDASVISLLVSAPIDLLEQAVDGALPAEEGEEKRWLDGSQLVGKPGFQYQYRIWRGKPQVKAIRDHLEVSFPDMKYRFRGRLASDSGPFGGSCGYDDPPKSLAPQGVVQLSWSPDGTLRTSTEFDPAAFPEACKLSPVDVDATPVIRKLVADRLPATGRALDAAFRAQSLSQKRVVRLWKQLAPPSEVEPNLWVTMRPTSVTAAPFTAETERSVRTALSVMIRPTAVIGPRPAVAAATLPPVRVAPVHPAGLHVALPIRVTYAELNRRLSKQLAGSAFDAGPLGEVKIVSTYLYGSGDKVILQLDVAGGVNGRIYSVGKPVFDPATATLAMEGFDLTVDTKNILARTANALAHGTLVTALEPSMRSDLKGRLEELRQHLEHLLNREVIPGLRIEASDVRFSARGVYPVRGGIEIQIVADAAARLVAH